MTQDGSKAETGATSMDLLNKTEEDLYQMALLEVRSDSRREGLWARALSEALGDTQKTEALYIRYRANQLGSEKTRQQKAKTDAERSEVITFTCPKCGKNLEFTRGGLMDIARAKRPEWRGRCPWCKHEFDSRERLPVQILKSLSAQPVEQSAQSGTTRHPTSTASVQKKGLAIASLACGIVGGWASTASIPAVICGHLALNRIKKEPNAYGGKGMAISGLILGYIGLVLAIALGTMRGLLRVQLQQMGY